MRRDAISAVALACLVACGVPEQRELELAAGDAEGYGMLVQPVLEPSCATLDCHGDSLRPLRLFAETGLRASDELRDAPLTAEELDANVRALMAVDPDAEPVEESLVLLEPLAVDAGGVYHEGGDVWPSTTDPSYRCLRAFLAGQIGSPAAEAACTEAYENVGLPPE